MAMLGMSKPRTTLPRAARACYEAAMTSPLPLPDWVPWWVHLAVLLAGGLFALLFLAMPFAVFGLKGRLEGIEVRLDEIQAEIRSLSLRLPEPAGMDDAYLPAAADPYDTGRGGPARPPIPPAPHSPPPPYAPPARPGRTEPRLY